MEGDSPFNRAASKVKRSPGKFTALRRIFSSSSSSSPLAGSTNMAETEEDFSKLPLPDRFAHKNWKVRKEGYEDAAKQFELTPDESDPIFRTFIYDSGLWKAAAGDSNVAAQQEGLAALCAFLKYGGKEAASRSRGAAVQPIYEKGLAATRPGAKANALEALLLYVEIDKPDLVIEELLPALSNKQPKVIAASLAAITAIFHNFGVRSVDPKPVLKQLPKIFGHADKNVRAEGQNLAVELYRWLKEAMKTVFWSELKPVQQQDLEKMFEKVKEEPNPKQQRFTRAQQAQMAAASATVGNDVGGEPDVVEAEEAEEEAVEVDGFDLAEPVDVESKIPSDFQDNMNSAKWKDRKEALDALFNVANTPRIKAGHFDDIIRILAKSMKDANIAVVTVAANCVEKLALGLRRDFAKYRSGILSPIMERLKEKKQSVTDALGAAMDAVFTSTSLTECLEEILGFFSNKNPNVKGESVKFLIRCLRTTRDVPTKAEQKSIADAATKMLTESTENLRSGGAEILGTLMKIIGERGMGQYLEGLDDVRKTKVKEYFETAEVKAKEKPKPVAKPAPKAAPTSAVGKKVVTGAKKPVAKKAAALAPPPSEYAQEPPPPKPTAKALPKPGGMSKLGGLKKPSGGTASAVASPTRRVISPPMSIGSDEGIAPSPSKYGMNGLSRAPAGGLAGRSLARPAAAPASPPPQNRDVDNRISQMQLAELEQLRAEKERLVELSDMLRSNNAKLTAEVAELQNQNAQLIEDHTRDVLQIKAKETQLVRARGECDVLRGEIESVRKEGERYKREVSRLGRESFGRERESMMSPREQNVDSNGIFDERNGMKSPGIGNGVSRPSSAALSRTGSGASAARPQVSSRPQSNYSHGTLSPSEEKENNDRDIFATRRKISPPVAAAGRTSPSRPISTGSRGATEEQKGGAEPAENWKRAAEVTSQLKARIEAMKVCALFSLLFHHHDVVACILTLIAGTTTRHESTLKVPSSAQNSILGFNWMKRGTFLFKLSIDRCGSGLHVAGRLVFLSILTGPNAEQKIPPS